MLARQFRRRIQVFVAKELARRIHVQWQLNWGERSSIPIPILHIALHSCNWIGWMDGWTTGVANRQHLCINIWIWICLDGSTRTYLKVQTLGR